MNQHATETEMDEIDNAVGEVQQMSRRDLEEFWIKAQVISELPLNHQESAWWYAEGRLKGEEREGMLAGNV